MLILNGSMTHAESIEDSEKPKHDNVDRPDHIAQAEQFTMQLSGYMLKVSSMARKCVNYGRRQAFLCLRM